MKCYKLVGSKDVWDYTWNASICSSVGGRIVSVHSDEENRVITAYAYSRTQPWTSGKSQMLFIGLHAPVGRWIWTDGSTYNYANWTAAAAYDRCDGTKDCAVGVWLTTQDGKYGSWIAYNYDSFPYYGTKTVCQIEPHY
ncbi:versican core protein-like protein [Aphelenchoides avenae]|nr:versican core protein-like protein [Aphelenchus avenae]